MAAPKKPNPGPGAAAARRKAQERKASDLREAGWGVLTPEDLSYLDVVPDEDVRAFIRAGGRPHFYRNQEGTP